MTLSYICLSKKLNNILSCPYKTEEQCQEESLPSLFSNYKQPFFSNWSSLEREREREREYNGFNILHPHHEKLKYHQHTK